MFFLVDLQDSRLLDFNQTACSMLGYAREEMLGQHVRALIIAEPAARREYSASHDELLRVRSQTGTTTYRRRDGSTFHVEVRRNVLQHGRRPAAGGKRPRPDRAATGRRAAGHAICATRRRSRVSARLPWAGSDAAGLAESAVQALLEGLRADAVAYLEPDPGNGELMVRALVGTLDSGAQAAGAAGAAGPLRRCWRAAPAQSSTVRRCPLPGRKSCAARLSCRCGRATACAACFARCSRRGEAFGDEELNFISAAGERAVHRTAAQRQRGSARLPGAVRRAHRAAQSRAARRPLLADDRAGAPARHAARRAVHRPGRLQAGQRHARPRRGRRAAEGGVTPAAGDGAPGRYRGTHQRRRVRRRADRPGAR